MARMRRKVVAGVVVLVLLALGGRRSPTRSSPTSPKRRARHGARRASPSRPPTEALRRHGDRPHDRRGRGAAHRPRPAGRFFGGRPAAGAEPPAHRPRPPDEGALVAQHGRPDGVPADVLRRRPLRGPRARRTSSRSTRRRVACSGSWTRAARTPPRPRSGRRSIIVSSHDGTVTALRREDGRKVWRVRRAGQGRVVARRRRRRRVLRLDGGSRSTRSTPRTGAVRWAYDTGGRINASPSIFGRRICVSTYAGSVFCLDRSNGKKLWSTYVRRERPRVRELLRERVHRRRPPVHDLARRPRSSRSRRGAGRVLWTYQMGDWGYATPAIAHGHVYVGGFDGRLRSLCARRTARCSGTTSSAAGCSRPRSSSATSSSSSTLDAQHRRRCASPTARSCGGTPNGRYSPGIATDRHYYFALADDASSPTGARTARRETD